jgi:hypothetical protein
MHSWTGVAALTVFGLNYLGGMMMGLLTAMRSGDSAESTDKVDYRPYHRQVGLVAFGLTTLAVLTGINSETGILECVTGDTEDYYAGGCSIAFSMGMFVLLAAVCVVGAVFFRILSVGGSKPLRTQETEQRMPQTGELAMTGLSKNEGFSDVEPVR